VTSINLGDSPLLRTVRFSSVLKEGPKYFSKLYYAGIASLKAVAMCFISCFNRMFISTDKEIN